MALNPDCGGHTVVVPGVIHLNLMAFASEEVTVLIVRKIPFYANTNACNGCTLCCSVINFRSLLTDFKCKSICCIQPFQLLFEVRQIFVHKMAIYIPLASDTKSNQTVCQCDNHTVKADLTTYWHNYDILTNIKPKQNQWAKMKAANVDSWKCDSILFLIVINTEVMTKSLVHNSQFHFMTEL